MKSRSARPKLQLPISIEEFASRLLEWYTGHKRDLPWRRRPEPYHVLLSEFMLQQTQVKTVLPYYERFLQAYPTLEDLARSEESEVLSAWSGLGYYNRARNLHRAAQLICEKHDGTLPRDYDQVLELPGVGRYTAGALLSIAYGEPLPILDGNIQRLLARYLKIRKDLTGSGAEPVWDLLSRMVQEPLVGQRVSDFNQALMEMGALICTSKNPLCGECPLGESCLARKEGVQDELPVRTRPRKVQNFQFAAAVVPQSRRFLLMQNRESEFLRGFWEFPKVAIPTGQDIPSRDRLEETFQETHGLRIQIEESFAPVDHRITFRKLRFHPLRVHLEEDPEESHGFVWANLGAKRDYPVPSFVGKIVKRMGQVVDTDGGRYGTK